MCVGRVAGHQVPVQFPNTLPAPPPPQVLLQEPNPGIEVEFWLPRERYGPFQAQAQVLGWSPRQPQPREVEPQPLESPTVIPPRTPIPTPGELGTDWVGGQQGQGPHP